jgi:hypothetical protein
MEGGEARRTEGASLRERERCKQECEKEWRTGEFHQGGPGMRWQAMQTRGNGAASCRIRGQVTSQPAIVIWQEDNGRMGSVSWMVPQEGDRSLAA